LENFGVALNYADGTRIYLGENMDIAETSTTWIFRFKGRSTRGARYSICRNRKC